MKYIDEYRDPEKVRYLLGEIATAITRPWVLMEICGGQTHAFLHHGLDDMLPEGLELVHGPGCPVCVTPLEQIDRAIAIASRPEVIFTSYGDMLRVPGSSADLFTVRAKGGDVRVGVFTARCNRISHQKPRQTGGFLCNWFRNHRTAKRYGAHASQATRPDNFSALVSHVRVPAMDALLSSTANRVQAFLAAGHVCAVMGYHEYPSIAEKYHVPIVVTGFEPVDLLRGVLAAVQQLEMGKAEVKNAYERTVNLKGNLPAQKTIQTVFMPVDRKMARHRHDPDERMGPAPRVCASGRRNALCGRQHCYPRIPVVHRRRNLAGLKETHPMLGLRQRMHPANTAGRAHGFCGGRLLSLLPISPNLTSFCRAYLRTNKRVFMTEELDFEGYICPVPIQPTEVVVLGHGSGGRLSHDPDQPFILARIGQGSAPYPGRSAVLTINGERLALTTDLHVVTPLFFPGGDIGRLAICETVNDLAMVGATPIALTCGLIIEEGVSFDILQRVTQSMRVRQAIEAGVYIAAGDTKVVQKGSMDQLFINTAGVGRVPNGLNISGANAQPGGTRSSSRAASAIMGLRFYPHA